MTAQSEYAAGYAAGVAGTSDARTGEFYKGYQAGARHATLPPYVGGLIYFGGGGPTGASPMDVSVGDIYTNFRPRGDISSVLVDGVDTVVIRTIRWATASSPSNRPSPAFSIRLEGT